MSVKQLGRRLLQIVIVLIGISFFTFILTYLAPGDPVRTRYAASGMVPTEKELQEEIDDLTSQIRNMKDYLPKSVQKVGYRNVQEFLKDFQTAKSEYRQYQKAIAQWKQETGKEPEPQPHGVRAKLAANRKKIEQEQKNTQRTRSQNQDRGAR